MNGQRQGIGATLATQTQVCTLGNDPLIAHQPLQALFQRPTGHQRVAHHMQTARMGDLRQVQANGRVAGSLDRAPPEPGHVVLSYAPVGVGHDAVVQAELGEQAATVETGTLQRQGNGAGPAR